MDIKKDDVLECFAKVSEDRQIDDLSARGFMDDKKFIQTAMQEISLADAENEKNAANGSGTGASQRQQSRTFGARNVGGTNKWFSTR